MTQARLDEARDRLGLRVQGGLVGDRETLGLMEVDDDIFWVRDWRRHGRGPPRSGPLSPVHSKSLTALYFPGAPQAGLTGARPDQSVQASWAGAQRPSAQRPAPSAQRPALGDDIAPGALVQAPDKRTTRTR